VVFNTDCEASRLDEAIELYKETIVKIADSFTEDDYKRVLEKFILEDSINLNMSKYFKYFNLRYENAALYNTLIDNSKGKPGKLINLFAKKYTTYSEVKEYLLELANAIKLEKLIIITDKES